MSELLGSKSEFSLRLAENKTLSLFIHSTDLMLLLNSVNCLGVPPSEERTKICVLPGLLNPPPSYLYTISSISMGGSFHFAPIGFLGI